MYQGCGGFTGYFPAERRKLHWLPQTTRSKIAYNNNGKSEFYIK